MRFSSLIWSTLSALAPLAAGASCWVCDREIEVVPIHADCFTETFDAVLSEIRNAEDGYAPIDFAACTGGTAEGDRGLMRMSDGLEAETPPTAQSVKTTYILDEASATCLFDLIREHREEIEPSRLFDLARDCPN